MLDIDELGEEYELAWPVEIFRSEAKAAARSETEFNDLAQKLLVDAFVENAPASAFRAKVDSLDLWTKSAPWMQPQDREPQQFLSQLADSAHLLPKATAARAYWIQRNSSTKESPAPDLESLRTAWSAVADELIEDGFYAHVAGQSCVDGSSDKDVAAALNGILERLIGQSSLWPLPPASLMPEDLFFTVIEAMHDLAARPRQATYHSFDNCGLHYRDHVRKPGQALYRWRTNKVLERHGSDLRLAEHGEDRGRLVRHFSDPRAELMHSAASTEKGPNKASVEHAITLFRKRDATREDKRSACVALALVLEERRKMLKANLLGKDEGMLFDIANNYDVRHRDGKQHSQFGDEFQDWIFWMYLGTVELTNRLLARIPDDA